jgi:hypothetical protein
MKFQALSVKRSLTVRGVSLTGSTANTGLAVGAAVGLSVSTGSVGSGVTFTVGAIVAGTTGSTAVGAAVGLCVSTGTATDGRAVRLRVGASVCSVACRCTSRDIE